MTSLLISQDVIINGKYWLMGVDIGPEIVPVHLNKHIWHHVNDFWLDKWKWIMRQCVWVCGGGGGLNCTSPISLWWYVNMIPSHYYQSEFQWASEYITEPACLSLHISLCVLLTGSEAAPCCVHWRRLVHFCPGHSMEFGAHHPEQAWDWKIHSTQWVHMHTHVGFISCIYFVKILNGTENKNLCM